MRVKRVWTWASVALVCIGAAMAMHRCRRERKEMVVVDGMTAVSADTAVLVWRAEWKSWVGRVDGHGETVWIHSLPGPDMSVGGTGPIAIVDGVAVVRYAHMVGDLKIDNSAIAYDLENGHLLWDHVITMNTSKKLPDGEEYWNESLPPFVSDVAAGDALYSFANGGDDEVIVRTDVRSGALTPRYTGSLRWNAPIAVGNDIVLNDGFDSVLLGGETGLIRKVGTKGVGCAVNGEYVVVEPSDGEDGARLVAYAAADAAPRVIAAHFTAFSGWSIIRACGRRDDRLVFLIETSKFAVEAIVTDRVGNLLHRIELGHSPLIMDRILREDPDRAFFSGELPRFVPFPDYRTTSLVMADLDTGTIAWRANVEQQSLFLGELFHVGSHWIWLRGEHDPTFAIFDGDTGNLSAAARAEGVDILQHSALLAIKDTLWLYAHGVGPLASPGIAVLDITTLKPRFARGINLVDTTAQVRTSLGR